MKDELQEIPLNDIVVVSNTRSDFADDDFENLPKNIQIALKELAVSIKTNGVLQPILVKPHGTGKYRLICGERRYRASLLAGKPTIPARIKDIADDKILQVQIVENLQRKNITTMDEVRSFKNLRDIEGLSEVEISKAVGKHTSHIYAQLRIAAAVPELHTALETNQLSRAVALLISGLESEENQIKAVDALKRDKAAFFVRQKDAEKWINENFGVSPKKAKTGKFAPINNGQGRFASDWKYYLLRFNEEQFTEWRNSVNQSTEFTDWAAAVETVMEQSSRQISENV